MKKAIVLAIFLALFVPSSAFAATREEQIASLLKQIYALQVELSSLKARESAVEVNNKERDTCFRYEQGRHGIGCSALGG